MINLLPVAFEEILQRNRREIMKSRLKHNLRIIMIMAVTTVLLLACGTAVHADPVRQTDTTTAASGNILVGVPGYFENKNLDKAIARVNEIRREACQNGYINPSTGNKLTMSDYVPIKWSGDLEWIAQTRAAEAFVYEEHIRPNGESCFSVSYKDEVWSSGEVLAWGASDILGAVNMWYGEKNDWVKQNSSAVTGHYTSMIDPENLFMGMACFGNRMGAYCASAGEFSCRDDLREYRQNFYGDCVQMVEVTASSLKKPGIAYQTTSLVIGATTRLMVFDMVSYDGWMNASIPVLPTQKATWSVSKKSIAKVSQDGTVTGVGSGSVVVKAAFPNGRSASLKIKVSKAKVGSVLQKGNAYYKVTKAGKSVEYLGSTKAAISVTIPATITLGKDKYKVTSIAKNAFYNNTTLAKVKIGKNVETIDAGAFRNCTALRDITIPANVKKIGKKAFYGCSKLKNVTIKTKKLTASHIGNNAFAKSGIKKVIVPKGKKGDYKAMLIKRGMSKKAKVK